ncbi:MAG: metal-dependent hydrolase, beta-lactamase superfamily [Gemmatimonadetes bacterium]|nr:metal-dependent hydrolase, beta-lactamase superfamily [Gemmatimonadota bacterium]
MTAPLAGAADGPGGPPGPALRATCWGTRGSIPSPGPETIRFGGNTSCVEVRSAGGRCYIFDAGTGIRPLSRRLADAGGVVEADLFVTHFHWDHIQGFPFCTPLYDPGSRIRVHGPRQGDVDISRALAGQMGSIYFPIPLDALAARVEWVHVNGHPWSDAEVEVAAMRVRHAEHTCGYRIRSGGASVAYIPDNELGGAANGEWYDRLVGFLEGVDLLFHDAMFTDGEYDRFRGWGHSTYGQAVRLAEDAGVRRLALFHHAPDRGDDELDALLAGLRADLADRGSPLELSMATEGEEMAVHPAAVGSAR